jgi:hypothetical protein
VTGVVWRSASVCETGDCVEVAFVSACEDGDDTNVRGKCVEVARCPCGVRVRDSKDPDVVLTFTWDEWAAFIAGARDGEFDA